MKPNQGATTLDLIRSVLPDHPDEALPRSEICRLTGLGVGVVRDAITQLLGTLGTVHAGPRSYKYYLRREDMVATSPTAHGAGTVLKGYDAMIHAAWRLREATR